MREEAAVLVELRDAIVVADAVGDVDVAGAIPRDVCRTLEARTRNARARRPSSLATAATADHQPRPLVPPAQRRTTGAAPGAAPPDPPPAHHRPVRSGRRIRSHGNRFGLSAEDERDAAFGIELHDLIGRRVDRPHVVLRIDAQSDCCVEAVDVLADLAHELPARVELKQPRPATRERAMSPSVAYGWPVRV